MAKCVGFPAVCREDARVLILGSLPSEESLKRQHYYAKKANSFWRIMAELTGAQQDMPYENRLHSLIEKRIALWDVCATAERVGSLDANIQPASIMPNDFPAFFLAHPQIELICFNGQPAEKVFRRAVLPGLSPMAAAIPCRVLPSTSPAHARSRFDEKLALWREALADFII